jgi:methyl-accepting chemotaxis protein
MNNILANLSIKRRLNIPAAISLTMMVIMVGISIWAMQRQPGGLDSLALSALLGTVILAAGTIIPLTTLIAKSIATSADSIQVASSEVAAGTLAPSQFTERAAADLQQTASSVEQLAKDIGQNPEAADMANQLATSTSDAAERGDAVTQSISQMQDITSLSRCIADIIGTIEGIAFKTNILALNVAVEAAKAGSQGREFSIVAGEVRTLAQRSADAAQEIKDHIVASVDSRLCKTTRNRMNASDVGEMMRTESLNKLK